MPDETPNENVEAGIEHNDSSASSVPPEARRGRAPAPITPSDEERSERRLAFSGVLAAWIGVALAILTIIWGGIYAYINFRLREVEELRSQLEATHAGIIELTSIVDAKTLPDYPPGASDELKAKIRAERRLGILEMQCIMLDGEWKDGFCAPLGKAYEGLGLPPADTTSN